MPVRNNIQAMTNTYRNRVSSMGQPQGPTENVLRAIAATAARKKAESKAMANEFRARLGNTKASGKTWRLFEGRKARKNRKTRKSRR